MFLWLGVPRTSWWDGDYGAGIAVWARLPGPRCNCRLADIYLPTVRFTLVIACLLLAGYACTQTPRTFDELDANRAPRATVVRFADGITLDGKLDELEWRDGEPAKDFWETFPSDTSRSAYPTEIYFGYDNEHLYVAALCRTPGVKFVIPSLRRDFRAGGNDNITFLFNPFRDKSNAIVSG